ncbi:hypothetical protein Pan241w_36920 [Gimesia alba]|uniref:Uncharacterized protein n=1 Tax=Gimesia alba TaxID=2527973 RepID=A0A517RI91_9PLAN|nr:hypothetical protein Pan241w_36920 [Gimesia alba]
MITRISENYGFHGELMVSPQTGLAQTERRAVYLILTTSSIVTTRSAVS